MKLQSMLVVLLGLQICQPAVAGSLFRCEVDGRVEFSDRRCQPVKQKAVCPQRNDKTPASESLQGPCATPVSDAGSVQVVSSATRPDSRAGVEPPGRLALNDIGNGARRKSAAAGAR
ncbi:MAG: hypothetical protein XXXNARYT_002067 [Candidatus Accumulibacter regalis]|uniref:hypothetical protein n=1 Tax=Accumulibacter sp. TaxID=2053492 RepID=UPI001AC0FFA0|nr:hypothetical protein [Accumulibacter sp.]MBN8514421.1 hypothetical protein [Accumulibacter sp.]MBO3701042.1 hypothetical protein [Accumulibacter sp.]